LRKVIWVGGSNIILLVTGRPLPQQKFSPLRRTSQWPNEVPTRQQGTKQVNNYQASNRIELIQGSKSNSSI
jgi:hypothetical protein